LIIYGKGAMQFMMRSIFAPWSAYADQITSIEVTSGVETIADNAFSDCSNVTTVSMADTVKSIGAEAFVGCESLETVTFTGDAPEIGENCFEDVSVSIQYPENNATWTEEVQESFGGDITWVAESCEELGEHSLTDATIENKVDATCEENGFYEAVKTCSACGKEFRDTVIVPALGHDYTYTVNAEPTEAAAGELSGACANCQATDAVVLPKLNKTDYTYTVVAEPTETATGIATYTWKNTTYGEIAVDVVLEKLTGTTPGDMNGDGVVTDKDVIALLWHVLFPSNNPIEGNGDINGDGVVTDKDVIALLWHVLFPSTYPL
jgi:hypothetical protein